jgi:hypothetical protein
MSQATDYSTFGKLPAPQRQPTAKEREAVAGATQSEAKAVVAPELTAAQLRAEKLRGDKIAAEIKAREDKAAKEAEGLEATTRAAQDKARSDKELLLSVLKNIQLAKDKVSALGATGPMAQITGGVFSSPAKQLEVALKPIKSQVVLEALQRARVGSAVGATGFGALQIRELELLENMWGALSSDLPPEDILRTLEEFDTRTRRFLSYDAGYDPDTPEGATMFGLPMPEGAEDLPVPAGAVESGRMEKNPELAGIDAAVTSMIKAGRSAGQIRQYLNEYQPGLGDKARNIEANINYWKKTGEDPGVTIERYFVPEQAGLIQELADTPAGAGATAFANQMGMGLLGLVPGEEGQRIRAVQRGLSEKYPTETTIGDIAGGIGSAIGGAGLGRQLLGGKAPALLEGVVQEGIRGGAMAEPGERGFGALEGSATALAGNAIFQPISRVGGNIVRGFTPGSDAATLSQKYDINLTPGQIAGVDERTLAGAPVVGSQVQARRNESLVDFNRAAFEETLAPLGTTVPDIGQKGIAQAQQAVSEAYDAALGGRTFVFDAPFVQTVRGKPYADLVSMKGDLGPKTAGEIDRILSEIDVNGAADGRAWQQARRQLVDMQNSRDIKDDISGNTVRGKIADIIDAFDGLVERQAPEAFEGYMAANIAHRNTKILERAVENARGGDVFGPGNLRTATKQGTTKFGGSAASARGERPFNEITMSALGTIPERVDDVSLVGRLAPVGVGAGAAGGVSLLAAPDSQSQSQDGGPSYVPPWLLAAGAGAGLASLPYSRGGTRVANALMGGARTDMQRKLGDLIYDYMSPAARGALIGSTQEPGVPMPQEPVDPGAVISPEMMRVVRDSAAAARPDPEAPPMGGFEPTYADVDELGRVIDPLTGLPIEEEEVVGMQRGGAVKGYKDGGLMDMLPDAEDVAGFGRSVARGATFATNDEIEAYLRTLFDKDPNAYENEVNRIRRAQRQYEEDHPGWAAAGELGGAVGTAFVPGMQGISAARVASMGPKARAAYELALATGQGSAYGAGSMYDDPDSERDPLAVFLTETAAGTLGYPAGRAIGAGGRELYRRVPQGTKDFVARNARRALAVPRRKGR